MLSRAGRAQRGFRCWLEEGSGVDLEGTQGNLVALGGTGGLGGLRWSVGLGEAQSSA